MELINQIGVERAWGFRAFELYQGDLMRTEPAVDVLVISAAAYRYPPAPRTMMKALSETHDISVGHQAQTETLDYWEAFRC
jgi:hypothetical protein